MVLVALVASGIAPYDRFTWVLEIVWVAGGLALYPWFRGRRQPTTLLLVLLCVHALILIWGGYHTYARVPLGEWMRDWFGFSRNHYDRIGHFAQGFVPAILTREILLRSQVVRGRGWLWLLVVSVCIAFSACFELIEWAAAMAFGDGSTDYLATQGDEWDAQKDMLMAGLGANAALLSLSRLHDRFLRSRTVA
jgi:putative membrane protein